MKVYMVTDSVHKEKGSYHKGVTVVLIGVFSTLELAQKAVKQRLCNIQKYVKEHMNDEVEEYKKYGEEAVKSVMGCYTFEFNHEECGDYYYSFTTKNFDRDCIISITEADIDEALDPEGEVLAFADLVI